MPTFEAATEFACPPLVLFDFLLQPANVLKVSPPELNARLVEGPERAQLGSRITIEARNLGMRHRLSVVVVELEPNALLTDEQVEGPFRKYRNERRLKASPGGVLLTERIDFEPPGGMLGLLLSAARLEKYIAEAHAYRVTAMRSLLSAAPELIDDEIEVLRPSLPRGRFRGVLFDFDGTLSLIREGWPQVMIPMMVEVLRDTNSGETDDDLAAKVEEFVMRLNGRQTIYQMIQLVEEVKKRGGTPREPLEYKHRYHELLMQRIRGRLADLESGRAAPADWVVPESHALLDRLRQRGLTLYLASGTDIAFVRREAELLGVAPYFGEHIYGALDDYQSFSKRMIVDKILSDHKLHGEELLGFGDGFVEIEEVRRAGGVAVAVASDEVARRGVNQWKRNRLVEAGADVVIPEYRRHERLLRWLFAEE